MISGTFIRRIWRLTVVYIIGILCFIQLFRVFQIKETKPENADLHTTLEVRVNKKSNQTPRSNENLIILHDHLNITSLVNISSNSTNPPKEDLNQVAKYFKDEEKVCLQQNASNTTVWCPCIPTNLRGRLSVDRTESSSWDDLVAVLGRDVLVGGEWSPSSCTARTHLAVIIPYRDRETHLRIMLRHLYPILQRQMVHFRIFVVEQNSPAVFNKASIMNVGFLEASKRFRMNCVMFHDVDHLLEDDRALMRCGPNPHHYAVAMDRWNYRLIYGGLFGGVVSMTPSVFQKVNGYSNQFFGWGGEDDDMGTRVRQFFRVIRPPNVVARYSTIRHDVDSSNPTNTKRHRLMKQLVLDYKKGRFDGLSDTVYQLESIQLRPLFTWLHVNLNVSSLPYPLHAVSHYRKTSGVCPSSVATVTWSGHVSMVTCRYKCDIGKIKCVGFLYSLSNSEDKLCSLLKVSCVPDTSLEGSTYFKLLKSRN